MNWTGLAATAWDPSGGDEPQADYAFIRALLEHQPGPALDVGCGTGRLLLRYLRAGLDVDGVDTSADMLAICQQKAAQQGLRPALYQQALQQLDLPRRYHTVFIPCGTFCLIIDRHDALEALRRVHAHLVLGGLLVFNLFWPFSPGEPLSAQPHGGEGEWGALWTHSLPDGSAIAQHYKREAIDRVEQLLVGQRRYQWIQQGRIVQEEIYQANERWYFKREMVLLLEKVGFRNVRVKGDWTDGDFTEPHSSIVFIAAKG